MDKTPFEILGEGVQRGEAQTFINKLGIVGLAATLEAIAWMSAVIVILLSMFALLIVNYPKTVAQTKQRIAQAILSALFVALLPLFMDIVYNTCLKAFYGM